MFQSRNRGAFGFKYVHIPLQEEHLLQELKGFNLVIEVLLVSSQVGVFFYRGRILGQFQSRNRGAFGFKPSRCKLFRGRYRVSIS